MGRIRKDNPKIFCHLKPEAEKFLRKELAKIGRNKMGEYLSVLLLAERDRKYPKKPKTKPELLPKQPESKEEAARRKLREEMEKMEREGRVQDLERNWEDEE
jgi:hypothetical protein